MAPLCKLEKGTPFLRHVTTDSQKIPSLHMNLCVLMEPQSLPLPLRLPLPLSQCTVCPAVSHSARFSTCAVKFHGFEYYLPNLNLYPDTLSRDPDLHEKREMKCFGGIATRGISALQTQKVEHWTLSSCCRPSVKSFSIFHWKSWNHL